MLVNGKRKAFRPVGRMWFKSTPGSTFEDGSLGVALVATHWEFSVVVNTFINPVRNITDFGIV